MKLRRLFLEGIDQAPDFDCLVRQRHSYSWTSNGLTLTGADAREKYSSGSAGAAVGVR
ncbi:MAG TPA: hypothetical protein VNA69_24045 [Thermoanaerobaculia bacterium]|nr:hypothetical protein [Thermoanaerobaculia bacterium]